MAQPPSERDPVLEGVNFAVCVLDPDWRYVYLNTRAAHLAMKNRDELLGKCLWEALPSAIGTEFHKACLQVEADRNPRTVREYYPVTDRWVESHIFAIPEGFAVNSRQVRGHESRHLLQESQRLAHIGSWNLDLRTRRLEWSDEIFRIFEIDPARFEASYDTFLNAVHPEDRARVHEAYTHSIQNRTPYQIEHRLLMPDGRIKEVIEHCETYYDAQGAPIRSIGTVQDITDRKQAQDRFRTLFLALPDSMVMIDPETLQILEANEAAVRTYGYSPEEFKRLSAEDISTEPERARRSLGRAVLGVTFSSVRTLHRRKGGDNFPAELTGASVTVDGRVIFLLSVRDISHQMEMERALLVAKERAEAGDRMKSEFLDIAAHELKTPLTALSLSLESIQRSHAQGKPLSSSLLDRGARQLYRLRRLVNDLLDVSRLERGQLSHEPADLDLAELLAEGIEEFRSQYPERVIRFEREPSDEPALVRIDPIRIQQVLTNLLDNARKYTEASTPIEVRLTQDARRIRVAVTDQGPGIPERERANLFNRFIRGTSDKSAPQSGLGLGLYICRSILERHSGRLALESETGKGSVFYFDLPKLAPLPGQEL